MARAKIPSAVKLGALGVGLGYLVHRVAASRGYPPSTSVTPGVPIVPSVPIVRGSPAFSRRSAGRRRALLIGASGGVARALLHLLWSHPDGRAITAKLDGLLLVDSNPPVAPRFFPGVQALPPTRIEPETLSRVIRDHQIDQVIEVASVDTRELSRVCAAHGADYVSAAISADGPILVAAKNLLANRPDTRGTSQIIASGMNPGVVEALANVAIDEFRRRVGVTNLELHGVHVTEEDTTRCATDLGDVFAMSWSPDHALDELLEAPSMYVAADRLTATVHQPHRQLYAARVGDREVATMLVPHEELISMARLWPGVESGFFYAIPIAAQNALRRYPDRKPEQWKTRRLYCPHTRGLVGYDRVGCLLSSQRYGELWAGFEHHADDYATFGNGTLLQTAAGMLAAWSLLGSAPGLHVVSEIDARAYLAVVQRVLGPYRVFYDPRAPVRYVADRGMPSPSLRRNDRSMESGSGWTARP